MIKTVLVTGGLGYLGGRICHHLSVELGLEVRLTTSRAQTEIPGWAANLDVRHLDLRENTSEYLSSIMEGVDTVVHLAALNAPQCEADPADAIVVNVGGTQSLVSTAVNSSVNRFIYISTAHVYGAPLTGRIDETTASRPSHPYAWTHRAAEDIVLGTKGLDGVALRLSNVVGAPMDEGANCWMLVGPDLCRQVAFNNQLTLSDDGSALRDFVCMSDVVKVIAHVMQLPKKDLGDGLFNVGKGRSMTIFDLAERIASAGERLTGKKPLIRVMGNPSSKSQVPFTYAIEKIIGTGFSFTDNYESELMETLQFCSKLLIRKGQGSD